MSMNYVTEEWIAERRAALPEELLALVRRESGRVRSHYVMMPISRGGARGLTDDKEFAFERLIADGKIEPGFNRGPRKSAVGWYPAGHPDRQEPLAGGELGAELLKLVELEPGRAPSHYCRLSMAEGGVAGSQERKERALQKLLDAGLVRSVPLPRPVGRKTHGLYPAEKAEV